MKRERNYIIPLFIPELACPFQCVFCNQKIISGALSVPTIVEIEKTVEMYLSSINPENTCVEIAFFGGNFTGIPRDDQVQYLKSVQKYIRNGRVASIRLSTRPDYINHENLKILKSFSVKTIELGAQSLFDDVLLKSGRGHKVQDVIEASSLIKEMGFELGLQMMIGLPGDTKEKSLLTANKIIELGATSTRIYPTLVIKGTKLEELYNQKKYTPLSLEEAVNWTKDILLLFEKNNVTVLRIGLHPSEGLLSGHDLVAGPFHQSFRELVLTEIWNDYFEELLTKNEYSDISITVNKKELNYAVGYNSKNKNQFCKYFKNVKFIPSDEVPEGDFRVDYN